LAKPLSICVDVNQHRKGYKKAYLVKTIKIVIKSIFFFVAKAAVRA
jgi:hypothetical protein